MQPVKKGGSGDRDRNQPLPSILVLMNELEYHKSNYYKSILEIKRIVKHHYHSSILLYANFIAYHAKNSTSLQHMTLNFRTRSLFKQASIIYLFVCTIISPIVNAQDLPELSDSAALIMNTEQEKMFGKQVMLNVRASSSLSNDVLLLDYFSTLAGRLARQSPRDFGAITASLAIDPTINAFAVPGGYITINTGLIENTRSEAELASVIAHEIGHQSQRHIARSIERSKQLSLPAKAAMLGGLLLGGQAGTAAILSAQAALVSDQLSYSRTFEREADATGMNMLAAAGYEPVAMANFFSQLEKQSRLYGGSVIEFLSTHPVSSDRIADGRSRAHGLKRAPGPEPTAADRLDYQHAEARALALYNEPPDSVIKTFEHTLNNTQLSAREQQVAAYGLAIAYTRKDDYTNAYKILHQLRKTAPNNPLYRLLEAELALASGDAALAKNLFEQLYESDKAHPGYTKGYTQALINNGDTAPAIRILRKTIRHEPEFDWPYGMLARAYADEGKMLNAILVEALELERVGLYGRALTLLTQQQQTPHPDSSEYLTASINSLITRLQEEKRKLDNFDL